MVHLPAFRSVAGFEVVALCARGRERLKEVGASAGIRDIETDWESFVRRDDLDLISVATPVSLHRRMVEDAFAAGKHALCEKPAGRDAAEVRAMAAAAAASGCSHAVGFELRWLPEHLALRDLVESGRLGQPFLVQTTRNTSMWHAASPRPAGWKLTLNEGGGFLNAVLVHDLDLVDQLFGQIQSVCATLGRSPDHDAEHTAALSLRLQSGAIVNISGTTVSARGSGYRLEVSGSRASAVLDSFGLRVAEPGGEYTTWHSAERQPQSALAVPATYPLYPQVRAMALLLEDWLPALTRGGPGAAPTFMDALRAQQVIDAARQSHAGAGWIDVT